MGISMDLINSLVRSLNRRRRRPHSSEWGLHLYGAPGEIDSLVNTRFALRAHYAALRASSRPAIVPLTADRYLDSGRTGARTNTPHTPITKKGPAFGQTLFSLLARPERFELPASASGDRSISEEPRAVRVV
jgi:hypothetical protein